MTTFKINLFLLFITLNVLQCIRGYCVVKYPGNPENSPIYKKQIGKYSVELPHNGNDISLNEGETIKGICRTSFSPIRYMANRNDYYHYINDDYERTLENAKSITLKCLNNKLYVNELASSQEIFECSRLQWSIYDANDTFEWCEINPNAKTFLLATKSSEDHHILAGICFNLNGWSLQAITYNVTSSTQKHNNDMVKDITKTDLKSYQSLGDDLLNLETTMNFHLSESQLQEQLRQLGETNLWLHLATYEMSSIVQGNSYINYFKEYANILNTIWWRNLRLGNWKLFLNTLENYAHSNSFQLYTGTSGAVKVPTNNFGESNVLKIKNGYLNETIPAYIWTYLTSIDNLIDDFIIVGYNSPYAEFFTPNEVVFCPNICSEIPWLKEIYKSFHFATAGIMFCCSPEYISDNNYLTGFPTDVLLSRLNISEQSTAKEFINFTQNMLNAEHEATTVTSQIVNEVTTVTSQYVNADLEYITESVVDSNENYNNFN